MATKLKKLRLTSVDLVKRGANQDADICLYKSDTAPEDVEKEKNPLPDDQDDDIEEDDYDTDDVDGVEDQEDDLDDDEDDDDEEMDENPQETKKGIIARIVDKFSKPKNVEKAAQGFKEIAFKRENRDAIWKMTDALQQSIFSTVEDETMGYPEKVAFMHRSIDEFADAMKKCVAKLVEKSDTPSVEPVLMKSAPATTEPDYKTTMEGETTMKKFDTSNMTNEEAVAFDALLAKAVPVDDENVGKSDEESPILKAALERMEKLEKSIELQKFREVAKKYAAIGEKEEELSNTLYDLAKSSEANYKAYLAVLDKSLDVVNKSGIFVELGKSGNGDTAPTDTIAKINKAADDIMKADPSMSREDAVIKAWDTNPELIHQYDSEYKNR